MGWKEKINCDSLLWLLEEDELNPGVRCFALRELEERPENDPAVRAARRQVMETGPVPAILAAQSPEGWWAQPKPLYRPKYRGTDWQVIFLAQFGADGSDPRVQAGCEYVLSNGRAPTGGFSMDGTNGGMIHCLQGNLCAALLDLGWWEDERLQAALDWLARSITGEGIAPQDEKESPVRYLKSGLCGPGFCCSGNYHCPCAWGAVKDMLALSKVPPERRTPAVRDAIEMGIDFLLNKDPAAADYPMGENTKPSRSWFQFGYPIGYVTDVLQNLEALTALGRGKDPRLENALNLLLSKQDSEGRWKLEYTYNGKMWRNVEEKGKPSKWVTLRALRVLKRAYGG